MAGAGEERDSGFLSRWSRLKAEAGREAAAHKAQGEAAATHEPDGPVAREPLSPSAVVAMPAEAAAAPPTSVVTPAAKPPPLTLADVAQLARDSDFSRFVAPEVTTEVKNAALKKLFSDPHFNVMDGLDVYIDDYNKADPLPAGMLKRMVQARFVGLVKEEAQAFGEDCLAPTDPASTEAGMQRTAPPADGPAPEAIVSNEDADLQLQPHDAAGRVDADPGPVENSGHEH